MEALDLATGLRVMGPRVLVVDAEMKQPWLTGEGAMSFAVAIRLFL
ncbi:MAG TPA: hypothetical protein VFS38_04115 [Actinomycetota bacterium]|nr:hypothetical protein [Actinomycetota bacterium]